MTKNEIIIKNLGAPSVSSDGLGRLTFETENLPLEELLRLQQMLQLIILNGLLRVRSASMTLHINRAGQLEAIDTVLKWRSKDMEISTPL